MELHPKHCKKYMSNVLNEQIYNTTAQSEKKQKQTNEMQMILLLSFSHTQ
jgi:hypothetical protein